MMRGSAVALLLGLLLVSLETGGAQPAAPPPVAPPAPPAPSPAPPAPAPQTPQQPASPELRLIVPGKSIGGIAIGQPIRSVVRRLQPASESRPLGDMTVYVFPRFGIVVHAEGELVRAISTTNSVFRTREGLGVGSSTEEVRQALSTQSDSRMVENAQGVAYDPLGIAFGIERQTVVVVLVYAKR